MQTRSSVLGKRHASSEAKSPSSSSSSSSIGSSPSHDASYLPTPDATPNPKRIKMSATTLDGDNNKENIPPLRVEPINPLALTPRSLRRNNSEHLSPSRRGPSLRRHASLSHIPRTPASALSHLSISTPPPSPPSALRPLHSRIRNTLRAPLCAPVRILGRESERAVITDFISAFLRSRSTSTASSVLYISGSPGTGKTALVNAILGEVRNELNHAPPTIITVNCVALCSIDALIERLIGDLLPVASKDKKGSWRRKFQESNLQTLSNLFKQLPNYCILLLDELDHFAASPSVLAPLFSHIHMHSARLRAIAIANSHTMSSTSTAPTTTLTLAGVHTQHFAPYTPEQLLKIVHARLTPEDIETPLGSDTAFTKFLPTPTLTLLTRKIAATSGDVRVLFEVLQGAVDVAIETSADADATGNPMNAPSPSVSTSHVLSALKIHASTSATSRPFPDGTASAPGKTSDNEIVAKIQELSLQPRLVLLLLLLTRQRLESQLALPSSSVTVSSRSITPRTTNKRLKSLSASSQPTAGIDAEMLYGYYKTVLCRSEDGLLVPVPRIEFNDLLATLETIGVVRLLPPSSPPLAPSKGGKRCLSRTASLSSTPTSGGRREVVFAEGVRSEEIRRGLGIEDAAGMSDSRAEEITNIWKKESLRTARESELLSKIIHADSFDEAVQD